MSSEQPQPILSTVMPKPDGPEWQYATVLGGHAGAILVPGDSGPIVVRRRVSYGLWEAVTPNRFADDPTGTDDDYCGSEPPMRADEPGSPWGDCWCTKPGDHDDGECVCEPCAARHGAPGWAKPSVQEA